MPENQYKHYKINNISDALLALVSIISSSILNLDKYVIFSKEAQALIDQYDELIPAEEYEDLRDRMLFRQRELLESMADEAKDIFSYLPLRKKLVKMGYLTRTLDLETTEILNELHTIRNWTFHNVQSRLVAEKEVAEKSFLPELNGIAGLEPQLNPIIMVKYKAYTKAMVESFIYHNMIRSAQFSIILEEMKKDYQEMYDQMPNPRIVMHPRAENLVEDCKSHFPVKTIIYEQVCDIEDHETDVSNISMAIQKGKYDGTQESFENLTGRNIMINRNSEREEPKCNVNAAEGKQKS